MTIAAPSSCAAALPATATDFRVAIDAQNRVVDVSGDLDIATADALVDEVATLTATDGEILLDLSGLRFLCAAGIGAIVRISNTQRAKGSRVVLRNVRPAVHRALSHGGVASLLDTA